jgi:hypothetical protein
MEDVRLCFVSDIHYKNYTYRLKEHALKCFLQSNLFEHGVHFYISTNRPEDFNDIIHPNVKVFNIDTLRTGHESQQYEILPDDPTGIYPARFPWNLERFIIRKAAEDGFNYIISLDADVKFKIIHKNLITDFLKVYEKNTVSTNQAVFSYKNKSPNEVFYLHDKYFKHFNFNFSEDNLDAPDGPVVSIMADPCDIINFINNWDMLTIFGYKKEFGFGYDTTVCGNWSLAIPMSNFKLKWKDYPLYPDHKYEDRP